MSQRCHSWPDGSLFVPPYGRLRVKLIWACARRSQVTSYLHHHRSQFKLNKEFYTRNLPHNWKASWWECKTLQSLYKYYTLLQWSAVQICVYCRRLRRSFAVLITCQPVHCHGTKTSPLRLNSLPVLQRWQLLQSQHGV